MQLNTKQIYPPQPSPMSVPFVKPLSYEFRVHETVSKDGKVIKVKLQMQVWEHDESGFGSVKQTWSDVPRYQFDESGAMLPNF